MTIREDPQLNVFEMTNDELGLTPASHYRQQRHDAKHHLQGVKRMIRRAKRK